MTRVRRPAVAGTFYPAQREQLVSQIQDSFSGPLGPDTVKPQQCTGHIFGIICPHAGYAYSGQVAAQSYRAISSQDHDLAIILGPNHWGLGADIATSGDCIWQTPLGDVTVDSEAVKMACTHEMIQDDFDSHVRDHSLEVQLPMLQSVFVGIRILPIIMRRQDIDAAILLGNAVADVAQRTGAIVIASSDFTHYEANEHAYRQDGALLEAVCSMDVDRFYRTLEDLGSSACGYGAIAAAMVSCRRLGATGGTVLQYATSGDVTGDTDSVVGYGSVAFC